MKRLLWVILMVLSVATVGARPRGEEIPRVEGDTLLRLDDVSIVAVKQGLNLSQQAAATSVMDATQIERRAISGIKGISGGVPNFYMPDYGSRITSSMYVRGLGARIDNAAVAVTVDGVPLMEKNSFDTDMADIARVEMLRGPQTTLYGRNSMGGAINIYTLAPLAWQGIKFGAEYGTGNTCKFSLALLHKTGERTGISVSGQWGHTDGLFTNLYDNTMCDFGNEGSARIRVQHRTLRGLDIDNTIAFGYVNQGGYPYAYMQTGRIEYNDECSYARATLTEGLTLRKRWDGVELSSVSSYQFLDDRMIMDQDFLPESYFTLEQAKRMNALTEDIVVRSTRSLGGYDWLVGAFGFYNHTAMGAPVVFKQAGIDNLILKNIAHDITWGDDSFRLDTDFINHTSGGALYHESSYELGNWRFVAGVRGDFEFTRLEFTKYVDTSCTFHTSEGDIYKPLLIDQYGAMNQTFLEFAPRVSASYRWSGEVGGTAYATISRGYKAGGFNTQMFSEILRQDLIAEFGGQHLNEKEVTAYKPEHAWNYELGARLNSSDGRYRGDVALFAIDCRDQQLTVFPEDDLTGRRMTNAGRTRSLGVELSAAANPIKGLDLDAAWGFTDARFVEFRSGHDDYSGNRVPYVPRHTLNVGATYTIELGHKWAERIEFGARASGVGSIVWDEAGEFVQPFYALLDASVRLHTEYGSVALWGRNLTNTRYNTFCFASMGNRFLQRGKPTTLGVTLNITIDTK